MLTTTRRADAYVTRQVFRLEPDVDARRLQAAWQQLVRAAPTLRTRIVLDRNGGSLQVVAKDDSDVHWHTETALERYMAEDRSWGFVEGQPLLRFGLVTPDQQGCPRRLVITAHHGVYDGWSWASHV
jgi:hypothetical protein